MLDDLLAYQQGTRWWPIWRAAFNGPSGTRGLMMRVQPNLVQQWDWIGRRESTTLGTAPTYQLDEYLGPALDFTSNDSDGLQYSGGSYAGTARVDVTLAVVLIVGGDQRCRVMQTASTNAGMALQLGVATANRKLCYTEGGIAERDLTTVIAKDTPYFLGITVENATGTARGYVRRLDQTTITGTSVSVGTSLTAGDGNFAIANGPFSNAFDFDGSIALAYVGYECLTPETMRAWAMDPFAPFDVRDQAPVWAFSPAAAGGGATTFKPPSGLSLLGAGV